jgi:hypothetical protein
MEVREGNENQTLERERVLKEERRPKAKSCSFPAAREGKWKKISRGVVADAM